MAWISARSRLQAPRRRHGRRWTLRRQAVRRCRRSRCPSCRSWRWRCQAEEALSQVPISLQEACCRGAWAVDTIYCHDNSMIQLHFLFRHRHCHGTGMVVNYCQFVSPISSLAPPISFRMPIVSPPRQSRHQRKMPISRRRRRRPRLRW